jgi:HlyD family secretion protein
VRQVRQSPQTVQNVVTYDVVVDVDNTDLALKPGMTATSRLIVDERVDVLRVPNQALRYTPGGLASARSHGQAQVWLEREQGPVPVSVVAGLQDDSFTEIVGGGLKDGDQIIVAERPAGNGRPTMLRLRF